MIIQKLARSSRTILRLSILSLMAAGVSGLFVQATTAQSQLTGRAQSTPDIMPVVHFEPPTDESVDDSRGGASRPTDIKCIQDEAYHPSLTALLPTSQIGLTVESHPTFLVYIPPTSAPQAHFTLKDENNRGVYQTFAPLAQTQGILAVKLPEDSPPLELGATYQWSLALICQPTQTDIPIVSGRVQRIEPGPALRTQLVRESPLQQAIVYGQAGLWYDMLHKLARLWQTQPNDDAIALNWSSLLNSEGLAEIANEPFLEE
ncbi:MAG: DUF928 domain-containing protein [Leptolyngbyaceae cyanobacterium MO_188.B28]|nr:DUF928 domain-containing protein [Leptolyngbyaceae cyanobacterium MO_188.B28]